MEQSPEKLFYALLRRLGPDRVWRPLLDAEGRVLAAGVGLAEDAPDFLEELPGLADFTGKSVIDLGCNLGRHVFWALERGAAQVLGVDSDAEIVEAARALAAWRGIRGARFEAADFLTEPPVEVGDLVLFIDFIGKRTIAKGLAGAALDAAAAHARLEILATLRPVYRVADLARPGQDLETALVGAYGREFVRQGRFFLAEYAADRLSRDWEMELLSQEGRLDKKYKYALRFRRKDMRHA